MNKNIAIILLIFLVPLGFYWGLTRDKSLAVLPGVAANGAEIIKFSSPMCYECQELEKIFEEVYPAYANKISLRKVDVTQKNNETQKLIKQYEVKLVPTCVFKNENGDTIRRTEGSIQPKILENYMKEQING
ncbi:MAG: thioredoxin family protein [Candidatus Gastranaerophilales bacterium]|nr:thioredoxin family protein [Candidatus Gastranaerophilales bacterium]MCM1072342.1 thioredoxin family protein [Bacteroides sp.]